MSGSLRTALEPLCQQVQTQAVWDLPEYVQLEPPAWIWWPKTLVAVLAGALLLAFIGSAQRLEIVALVLLAAVWLLVSDWLRQRPSLPLGDGPLRSKKPRGCRVDLAAGTITTLGVEPGQCWRLEPKADWSLGYIAFGDRPRRVYGWRIELRHVRRGPVATVCTVLHQGHAVGDTQMLAALVASMAERLAVRRSGLPTAPRNN